MCVCNICIINFNSIPPYSCRRLSMSSRPFHYPIYTPTPMTPLLCANHWPSPIPYPWSLTIPLSPDVYPWFNPAKALEVPSLHHLSAQCAAGCAPSCTADYGGAGCYISLPLVTSLPLQSQTFLSINDPACRWVERQISFVWIRPLIWVLRPLSRPL